MAEEKKKKEGKAPNICIPDLSVEENRNLMVKILENYFPDIKETK